MFSCELSLRNLAAVAAVIIPIFTAVFKPSRPQTRREVCSTPQRPLGEAVAPLFAFGGAGSFPWFQVVSLCSLSGCRQWNLKSLCFQCHVFVVTDGLCLAWNEAFWPLVLVQWKSSFIKLGERSVGKGEAVAMHNVPCSSVQPWIRPGPSALSTYQGEHRQQHLSQIPILNQPGTVFFLQHLLCCSLIRCPAFGVGMVFDPDSVMFLPLQKFKELSLVPQCETSAWFSASGIRGLCVCKVLSSHWKSSMWLGCLQLDFLLLFLPCLVRIKFTVQCLCSWKTLSPLWNLVCHRGWWTFVWISWLFWPHPEIWHKQDELTNLIPKRDQD